MKAPQVSAIASGLRISIIGALFLFSAPRIPAQQVPDSVVARPEQSPIELKSGTTATLLSLIPGLGHFYAGEYGTGLALATLFIGARALGLARDGSTTGTVAGLVWLGTGLYAIIDAHNAAARYNRAHAAKTSAVQLQPVMTVGANGARRFGIAMQLQR
jgi:hypothetical protein